MWGNLLWSYTFGKLICTSPGLQEVNPEVATLLGSPIGCMEGMEALVTMKINCSEFMGSRLRHLQAHDAFSLLQNAFAIPKLYSLQSSPCFSSSKLHEFDSLQYSFLGEITNTLLSISVKSGGLSIRSAVYNTSNIILAPSAFLASEVVLMISLTRFFLTAFTMLTTPHLRLA